MNNSPLSCVRQWVVCSGLAIFLVVLSFSSARSANTWDGGGVDGNWSTAANWDDNTVPVNNQHLTFDGSSQLSSVNDLSIVAVSGITFANGAGAFALSGNALTLQGLITNNSANTQTVGMNFAITATGRGVEGSANVNLSGTLTGHGNYLFYNNMTAGTLTLGGIDISNNGTNRAFTVISNGQTVVNGVIANGGGSSAGAFGKGGIGELSLTQANTYGGATAVYGGTMTLDFSAAGAPTSNILYNGVTASSMQMTQQTDHINASVTTRLKGKAGTANTQTLSSVTIASSSGNRGTAAHWKLEGGSGGSMDLTLSAASNPLQIYTGGTLDISMGAGDSVTITNGSVNNGVLSGGTAGGVNTLVTLNGEDWASLDGSKKVVAATYTSSFTTTGSTNLDVTASGTISGTAVNTIRFNQTAARTVTVGSANTNIRGVLVTNAVGANDVTIDGSSINAGSQFVIFQNNTSGKLVVDAAVVGGVLVKSGAGTAVLAASANTYTGTTYVNEGSLLIGGSLSSAKIYVGRDARFGGDGSVSGTTYVTAGGILQAGDGVLASGGLASSANLTFADGAQIALTLGSSGTHSTLSRSGGTWGFDGDQAFTLTLNGATTGSYDNVISGLTGSETGLSSVGSWTITNAGVVGSFSYDGSGGVDLTLSAIPEPSTAILVTLFLGGLFARRKVR